MISSPKILIVDDNDLMRTLLRGILRSEDYPTVSEARNGIVALDAIAKIKVDSTKAKEVLDRVFKVPEETITYIDPQVQKVLQLFQGKAIGADIAGQTGWGLVNAVTEYADHHKRARSQGNRLDNAWFGDAANIKNAVFHEVLELAA